MNVLLELIIFVLLLSNLVILGIQRTTTTITYVSFSMVLYSRLHLVTRNQTVLRGVLYTIIAFALLLNIPSILSLCVPTLNQRTTLFQAIYYLNFIPAVQEIALSTMYIYLFFRFARAGSFEPKDKITFLLLTVAQLVILVSDVAMIALIYNRCYVLRMMLLPFAYALKLRIEFLVLNRLAGSDRSRQGRARDLAPATEDISSWHAHWKSWTKSVSSRRLSRPEASLSRLDAVEMINEESKKEPSPTISNGGVSVSKSILSLRLRLIKKIDFFIFFLYKSIL
jgi:hypothetical protein